MSPIRPGDGIRFSSRLGMLLTMIGLAVGLGNVWRFPYMMGSYGGSAFLLVYLGFTLLLAVPALSAEWALGRATGAGPPDAYRAVFGNRLGWLLGGVLLVTVLAADSYYLVVIGQILITAAWSLGPGFDDAQLAAFRSTLGNGTLQFGVAAGLLVLSLWIIDRGVRHGIEAASRWIVPGFVVVMAYLIIVALNLPGAGAALAGFLRPDFGALDAGDVFAALGQAFFSLGLGGTFHVVYGSYLGRPTPVVGNASLARPAPPDHHQPAGHRTFADLDGDPQFDERRFWPRPRFEPAFRELIRAEEPLILPLMQAMLQSLGCDPHLYDEKLTGTNFGFRLNYYPPMEGAQSSEGGRMLGHEDVDLFTLLPTPAEEGLQVLNRANMKWIRLKAPPGSIIINTGDYMQRISNDRLPSTTHRVARPGDPDSAGRARTSFPMAVYVWEDEILEVLPGQGEPKYPPIRAEDFHTRITSKYYGDDYAAGPQGTSE